MAIEIDIVTAPAAWASYLVYGDASGLDDHEEAAADDWLRGIAPAYVVDVDRDPEGEAHEERFTWSYRLYGGDAAGGSVLDYVTHRIV